MIAQARRTAGAQVHRRHHSRLVLVLGLLSHLLPTLARAIQQRMANWAMERTTLWAARSPSKSSPMPRTLSRSAPETHTPASSIRVLPLCRHCSLSVLNNWAQFTHHDTNSPLPRN